MNTSFGSMSGEMVVHTGRSGEDFVEVWRMGALDGLEGMLC